MTRLLSILFCCIIIISLSMLHFDKKEVEKECDGNPEASPVTDLTINSAMTFSNVLVNYSNIGIGTQAGAINCLVVSRTDSNLVLAGAQNGGVWISHNAARSWKPVNDTARSLGVTSIAQNFFRPNEFYYSTGVIIKEHGKLLFDIYRSVDYGQTFSLVNPIAFQGFGKVEKILPSPIDSNTLYVSHNQFLFTDGYVYRTADDCHTFELIFQSDDGIADMILLPDGTLEIGTKHSVWRSVTGDPGSFVETTGIDSTGYDTHLAYCASQPDIQYCSVNHYGSYNYYKSIDTGQTWTYLSTLNQGRVLSVKPDDPDFILAGTTTPRASVDGGLTWEQIIAGHDLRSFNYDPHRPGKVYVTSDFGVATIEVAPFTALSFNKEYRRDTLLYSQEEYYGDHGATGIQTFQGYQDLGCRYIRNLTQSYSVISGDGTYTWISKQNPDLGYFSDNDGDIYRIDHLTTNQGRTQILNQLDADHNGHVDDQTQFITPFVMNNADDKQLYFLTLHWLWRSTDRGNNWIQVSHHTGNKFGDGTIACTHKLNPIVYWTNSDSIFAFTNAATAAPLSELSRPAPFDAGRSYNDPDRDSALYLINRSFPSKISYCANLFDPTSIWTTIPVTMLPNVTIQCMAVYPGNDQIILVGSKEGGLYVTMDRGLTWTKEADMPNVQITEIKIRESDKKVFIFTFGRGTWTADFETSTSISPSQSFSDGTIYPNPFQDQLTIEFDHEVNGVVEICDMQGKLCLKKPVSGKQIKVGTEDLMPGFYLIRLFEGNKVIYQGKGIRIAT
ncbi:MAG: T9SS type A sorting domain-containing protein [Saprospiraceae bacterium]